MPFSTSRSRRYALTRDRDHRRRLPAPVRLVLLGFIGYLLVTTVLLQSLHIESTSMEPTFAPGERVFASPLGYGARIPLIGLRTPTTRTPQRGDLVVVASPLAVQPGALARFLDPVVRFFTGNHRSLERHGVPDWAGPFVVRRVIAVPGDRVEVIDHMARVTPEGSVQPSAEIDLAPFRYTLSLPRSPVVEADPRLPFLGRMDPITLGDGEYFVMGDHRGVAVDSRHTGPVAHEQIVSRIVFRYWPLRRFGVPSS
ncbi:MAG: signal peptidase I [Spirochaetaceae bacterium]|nr:MAG: signal peptidase I [Spirochaetaceae bacterium]